MFDVNPDHNSIFGDTYHGVDNPLVPVYRPYPTRFHGMVNRQPEAIFSYAPRPYGVPPPGPLGGVVEEVEEASGRLFNAAATATVAYLGARARGGGSPELEAVVMGVVGFIVPHGPALAAALELGLLLLDEEQHGEVAR